MRIDPVQLKSRLKARLTSRGLYPEVGLTLRVVMERAAALAIQVVEEQVREQSAHQLRVHKPEKPEASQEKRLSARALDTAAKRERLKAALSDGPLGPGPAARKAMLTPGECWYLLRHTPGIISVGGGKWGLA